MIEQVTEHFDNFIKQKFHKREIVNFLLNHERKNRCLEKVCEQIKGIEKSHMSIKFEINTYRLLIDSCAGIFCKAALGHAEEAAVSRLERQRRIDEANYLEEAEAEMQDLAKDLHKPETSYLNDATKGREAIFCNPSEQIDE